MYNCCCCIPIPTGTAIIAIFAVLELIACLIVSEWINVVLQSALLIIFIIVYCNRDRTSYRLFLFQAYSAILILNLTELIAMILIYLVL